jgi:hypothetical protein
LSLKIGERWIVIEVQKFIKEQKKQSSKISKRKIGLQGLKEKADKLPDLRKIGDNFEKKCFSGVKELQKQSNNGKEESHEDFKPIVLELGKFHSQLKEYQNLNDTISILAYYLPQLKINMLRNDDKKLKQIMNKFLKHETNLKKTISSVSKFENLVNDIEQSYVFLSEHVTKNHGLENQTVINDTHHEKYIDKLYSIHSSQKQLLFHIGKEFIGLSRKINEKK